MLVIEMLAQTASTVIYAYFLVFPIVSIVPTIGFFLYFLIDAYKSKQRIFQVLAIMFGVYILYQIFAISELAVKTPEIAQSYFLLSQLFQLLTLYTFLILLEMFEKNTLFSGRITLFTALVAIIIGAGLASIFNTNQPFIVEEIGNAYLVQFEGGSVVRILELIFGSVTGIWLIVALFRILKSANNATQKHLILWLTIGTMLIQVIGTALPGFIESFAGSQLADLTILQIVTAIEFCQNIGMFIIGLGYFRISKEPWLFQRQQVHLLLVYSMNGLDLYSKIFRPEITPEDVTLLTGVFSAISSIFQEATKIRSAVQSVKFEGKELRLVPRENFVVALLVEYATQASERALQKFAEDFEKEFKNVLQDFNGNTSQFQNADAIAERYFA